MVYFVYLKKMILSILQLDLHLHMFNVFKVIITLVDPGCTLRHPQHCARCSSSYSKQLRVSLVLLLFIRTSKSAH